MLSAKWCPYHLSLNDSKHPTEKHGCNYLSSASYDHFDICLMMLLPFVGMVSTGGAFQNAYEL